MITRFAIGEPALANGRLYDPQLATMEGGGSADYNQSDATGFIRLNALRLKVRAAIADKATRQS